MANPGFFQRQANARRNTTLLIALFLLAVAIISLAVCLVGYLVTRSETTSLSFMDWLISSHGLMTAGAVVCLIVLGSLVRWIDLAGGGERVARMVGARLIDPSTQDADERKLRNIVEEMSIASGVSVPQLYVMDRETGINAFVAGYSPSEAVMVVTHGALTQLNRDELQGVVGHEFSHILNGDMRINVRLIAVLAGILMIGQIGSFLLHSASPSSYSSRRNKEQGAAVILGLALVVIGYVGLFFGRLIQSAVSRQRELLADASSVQFTRNPEGIASALYKIGFQGGLLKSTSHASDMNHMCFGESTAMKFSRLLASHPPIAARINAIQPGLLARLQSRQRDTRPAAQIRGGQTAPMAAAGFSGTGVPAPEQELPPITYTPADRLSRSVGQVTERSEVYAKNLLERLPATFLDLLYTRSGAVQLCYALLTDQLDAAAQEQVLSLLEDHPLLAPQPALIAKLTPTLKALGAASRFPSLELAMPALRKLDPEERRQLIEYAQRLVKADGRVSLFEFAMISFLQRHLGVNAGAAVTTKYRSYQVVQTPLHRLFSLMARAGSSSAEGAGQLYREALAGFANPADLKPLADRVTIAELRDALVQLNSLSPLLKPAIIDACGDCVSHDGQVTVTEYEMLRLVADQLDCPMPPIAVDS
ncbi:M48 family metallopeptidase [Marinobacter sp. SS21]|uniref:M48 family metallopeptidase n=1 Tax=Marinobacter sp. SS21 TaxID=2979460 RepID=UPI00232C00A8|nr:M48 family metallopeptidase [Marinobacter sp. SS21]MDC0663851.1 M48 family metallopeptidase [Marinobacter sp. SS21]